MNILGKDTSPDFDDLYREVIVSIQKEVHFRPISEYPDPALRGGPGGQIVMTGDSEWVCFLDETLDDETFEHSAAHELYHLILESERYPRTDCLSKLETREEQLKRNVCTILGSKILDREIENRLYRQWNYNIWSRRERDGKEFLEELKREPALRSIRELRGSLLALTYMDARHWHTNGLAAAIEAQIERLNIELKGLGLRLRNIIDRYGHETPDKAKNSMIRIRDALRLNEWCKVMDPQTDQTL